MSRTRRIVERSTADAAAARIARTRYAIWHSRAGRQFRNAGGPGSLPAARGGGDRLAGYPAPGFP